MFLLICSSILQFTDRLYKKDINILTDIIIRNNQKLMLKKKDHISHEQLIFKINNKDISNTEDNIQYIEYRMFNHLGSTLNNRQYYFSKICCALVVLLRSEYSNIDKPFNYFDCFNTFSMDDPASDNLESSIFDDFFKKPIIEKVLITKESLLKILKDLVNPNINDDDIDTVLALCTHRNCSQKKVTVPPKSLTKFFQKLKIELDIEEIEFVKYKIIRNIHLQDNIIIALIDNRSKNTKRYNNLETIAAEQTIFKNYFDNVINEFRKDNNVLKINTSRKIDNKNFISDNIKNILKEFMDTNDKKILKPNKQNIAIKETTIIKNNHKIITNDQIKIIKHENDNDNDNLKEVSNLPSIKNIKANRYKTNLKNINYDDIINQLKNLKKV